MNGGNSQALKGFLLISSASSPGENCPFYFILHVDTKPQDLGRPSSPNLPSFLIGCTEILLHIKPLIFRCHESFNPWAEQVLSSSASAAARKLRAAFTNQPGQRRQCPLGVTPTGTTRAGNGNSRELGNLESFW